MSQSLIDGGRPEMEKDRHLDKLDEAASQLADPVGRETEQKTALGAAIHRTTTGCGMRRSCFSVHLRLKAPDQPYRCLCRGYHPWRAGWNTCVADPIGNRRRYEA